jgi:hypothetical protein
MADLLFPQLLRIRRKAHQCVDLAIGKKLHGLGRRVDDEIDVALGINAHVGRHGSNEDMVCRCQFGDGHRLSLEIANGPYALGPEQLETSRVHAPEQHQRQARVQLNDVRRDERHADVNRPGSEAGVNIDRKLDVLNVGETLAAQKLFGDVLRCDADAGNLPKTNGGGFRRRFLRRATHATDQTGSSSRGKRGKHPPATWRPPHDALLSALPD